MKKIISGKRYDTDKSHKVGEFDNINAGSSSTSDFHYWEAGLYRTPKSRQYFLAGRGGAMSRFARSLDQNSWGGGSDIIPMTRQEALEWAERYLSADEVEAEFGDIIEEA